jgi:hypothetical protein
MHCGDVLTDRGFMSVKPNGKICSIAEQIIEDPVSEITFKFEALDNGSTKLTLYGDLPFGNRELIFDPEGNNSGSGTATVPLCRPSWIREIK